MVRPASAYLKFGFPVNGRVVTVKWQQFPVRYFVTDRGGPGIGATAFADAVGRAFGTWEAVPSAAIRYQFGGFTSAVPGEDDGRTTIGFLSVQGPELDRVLASTSLLIDDLTGELLEADIFFNSAFAWSTSAAGEPGRFDVETIALHEIGHLNGLGHSAIGETRGQWQRPDVCWRRKRRCFRWRSGRATCCIVRFAPTTSQESPTCIRTAASTTTPEHLGPRDQERPRRVRRPRRRLQPGDRRPGRQLRAERRTATSRSPV